MPPTAAAPAPTRHGARIALILAAISAVFVAMYWVGAASRMREAEEQALRRLEARAGALAEAVGEQTRGTLYALDLGLRHLAHLYSMHDRLTDFDVASIQASTPPGLVRRVALIAPDGTLAATFPPGGQGTALHDRPHFAAHLADGQTGLYIGQPIRNRFDGEWVIPLSRRLAAADGSFAGVIAVLINPAYFSELFGRLAPGEGDIVALLRADGTILSRTRKLDEHLGKAVRADRPFLAGDAPEVGVFRSLSSYEPVDRLFAYRRLKEWPVVAVLGLGVDHVLAPVRADRAREIRLALAASALVLALLAGITVALLHLDRSLVRIKESDDRRAMASAGADELAWEWNVPSRRMTFFGNCAPFFGIAAQELAITGSTWLRHIHPDDRQLVFAETRAYVASGAERLDYRYRLRVGRDAYRWVLVRGRTVALDRHGRVQKALGIVLDVDAQRKAELRAAQLKEAYERLIESASEAIIAVDAAGRIELFNPAARQLFGHTEAEVLGRRPAELFLPAEPGGAAAATERCPIAATLLDGTARRGVRLNCRDKAGQDIPVELSVAPLLVEDELRGAVALIVDISRQLDYEAQLERLARTDGLTGLWNRRYFVELFRHEMRRAERMCEPLCLMMLDLDHFKQVNDRYGHAAGDAVLVAFAGLLKERLRELDVPGRLGGEEFCVGLPGITLDEARAVADRLRQSIAELEIVADGRRIPITVSIGVAKWDGRESLDTLLGRVDAALYQAKHAGRNAVMHA